MQFEISFEEKCQRGWIKRRFCFGLGRGSLLAALLSDIPLLRPGNKKKKCNRDLYILKNILIYSVSKIVEFLKYYSFILSVKMLNEEIND